MSTRFLLLIALLLVQLLYVPINRFVQDRGVCDDTLKTPCDAHIPLQPVWAIPYLLSLVWWWGCFFWAAWKMPIRLYRAFAIATLAVMLVSYVIYLVHPTCIDRPYPTADGWQYDLVRLIYDFDEPVNVFPSGHTYTAVLIALFWCGWRPRQRWLWTGITVLTVLSTLFTRQHNIPDLVSGIVLAWMGYRFGLWCVARWPQAVAP